MQQRDGAVELLLDFGAGNWEGDLPDILTMIMLMRILSSWRQAAKRDQKGNKKNSVYSHYVTSIVCDRRSIGVSLE
jgi:hypothetical protein